MSLEASSIAPWTKLILSSVRVASNWGLLARVFFVAEVFFGETFLFYGVTVLVGGYFGGVASPPSCPSASSPPPSSELDPFSSEVLSFSSVSIS
jgi:hypothetical protein